MSSHPSTDPDTGPRGQMLHDEILQELIDVATRTAHAQVDDLTSQLAIALQELAEGSDDPLEAGRCQSSAELLRKNRYPFHYLVAAQLSALLEQEILASAPALSPGDGSPSPSGTRTAHSNASLLRASTELEHVHVERLTLLNGRMSRVMGRPSLSSHENPFRPAVFLNALHQAWCEFQPDAQSQLLIIPLIRQGVCLNMEPVLHALNVALIKRGITPRLDSERSETLQSAQAAARPSSQPKVDPPAPGAFPLLFEEGMVAPPPSGEKRQEAQGNRATAPRATLAARERESPHDMLLQAQQSARLAVDLRIGSGEVLAFVKAFLTDTWVSVLTLAYRVRHAKPQAVESALQTMDDLIWSVKPKTTAAERKELVSRLPRILALLNRWLDLLKWHGPQRESFFDMLAECHASVVRSRLATRGHSVAEMARSAVTIAN